jgi:hypothetical protein
MFKSMMTVAVAASVSCTPVFIIWSVELCVYMLPLSLNSIKMQFGGLPFRVPESIAAISLALVELDLNPSLM